MLRGPPASLSPSQDGAVVVRFATSADTLGLTQLVQEAYESLADDRGLIGDSAPTAGQLRHMLEVCRTDTRCLISVAERDGVLVGFGELWLLPDLIAGGELALLRTLYVGPDERLLGIGSLILDQLVEEAMTRHAKGLQVTCGIENKEALPFCERRGLHATSMLLTRSL